MNSVHECHWLNNKIADLMIKEFCNASEYTQTIPGLLIDLKTGIVRGSETISNPFILVARYEYSLALINRHPELYTFGLLVASNYLKLSVRIKGIEDELAQKLAVVSRRWADSLRK